MTDLITEIATLLWSFPTVFFLFFTGFYLTVTLKYVQFRRFKEALALVRGKGRDAENAEGLPHFQVLATTLSGTIGTGNIAGVATAIALGGPGALFWMWVTALLGMAIKYTSCTLAHRYRRLLPEGIVGGPMITLEHGLGLKKLAMVFAFFTMCATLTTGAMVQSNSITSGLGYLWPSLLDMKWVIGLVTAFFFAIVVIGGLKRIAIVATYVVPFMTIFYCLAAVIILVMNIQAVPGVFGDIINSALNPFAAGTGALLAAMHYGVARGLFASEAGLGTAPMAQAAIATRRSEEAGLIAMLGPFIDTLIICTMTGLVILVSGVYDMLPQLSYTGAALSSYAFEVGLTPLGPGVAKIGPGIVGVGLVFFAYTTLLTWSYYGSLCSGYLFGKKAKKVFLYVMIALIIIGSMASLEIVWGLADIANLGMVIPNLIGTLYLVKLIKE